MSTETELDLTQFVEGGDGISVVRGGGSLRKSFDRKTE